MNLFRDKSNAVHYLEMVRAKLIECVQILNVTPMSVQNKKDSFGHLQAIENVIDSELTAIFDPPIEAENDE